MKMRISQRIKINMILIPPFLQIFQRINGIML